MNDTILYKLLTYLVIGIVIFVIFKYVPKAPMTDRDLMLVIVIVVLLYAVFDNAIALYRKENATAQEQCTEECMINKTGEHMTNIEPMENVPVMKNDIKLDKKEDLTEQKNPTDQKEQQNLHIDGMNGPNGSGSDLSFLKYLNKYDGEKYDDKEYKDLNSMPTFDITKDSYENGYSFMPPTNWYPVPPHPPVCVTDNRCPVCPVFTIGTQSDLKEWYSGNKK